MKRILTNSSARFHSEFKMGIENHLNDKFRSFNINWGYGEGFCRIDFRNNKEFRLDFPWIKARIFSK